MLVVMATNCKFACRQNLNCEHAHTSRLIANAVLCVLMKDITISFRLNQMALTLATIAVLAPSRAAMTH